MHAPDFVPDPALYPFESRFVDLPAGRMHYVDEGKGGDGRPPIVCIHGTPTWSFLYRRFIAELSATHRVIAPDHLGFGLSERPPDADFRPEALAANLGQFLDALELEGFVLVVHDFGGPIGLAQALDRPHRLKGIVLFNSWMWTLDGTAAARISRLLSGAAGRFLYTRLNLSPRVLLPAGFADRAVLTPDLHRHYMGVFPEPRMRRAPWVMARELRASGRWYASLWDRREALAELPLLLLWGMKDPAFGPEALARWQEAFPRATVREFPEAGHFVQEEAPDEALAEIRGFLENRI